VRSAQNTFKTVSVSIWKRQSLLGNSSALYVNKGNTPRKTNKNMNFRGFLIHIKFMRTYILYYLYHVYIVHELELAIIMSKCMFSQLSLSDCANVLAFMFMLEYTVRILANLMNTTKVITVAF
jgi:hypothetical protein